MTSLKKVYAKKISSGEAAMITSTANAQIKQIEKLHKSTRERRKTGLYLAEGLRMVMWVRAAQMEKA